MASRPIDESPTKQWRPIKRNSIPVTTNARVKKWVKLFNGNLRPSFKKWIKRLGYYGPTISAVLKEEKAPQDLIYLAMIESGLKTSAYSHAHAAGPWQFISSTGKLYGLDNGFFVDDRRDVVDSTRAAARHLKDLHKIYKDWYLAFAAYNAGSGKVNRAIRRGKSKNYWKLTSSRSRLFRQETKQYVPKILAALHIVKNYKKYGYSNKNFASPVQYERVTVPASTDFKAIAKSARTSPNTIANLNPSLVLGITPPGKSSIYVPKGAADEFKRNYAMIPSSKRISSLRYKTGRRETIASIAKKYGLSATKLARTNKIRSTKKRLKTGTVIKIPANKKTLMTIAKLSSSSKSRKRNKTIYYRVRPGDTLSRIAKKNKTTVRKLAKWNKIKKTSRLKIGQRVKIVKSTRGSSKASGGFLASYSPKKGKKLSGVGHIIIQDAKSGSQYKSSTKNVIELPTMTASRKTNPVEDAIQPGIIKTINGNVISTKKKQAAKTKKTKYHKVKPGESLYAIAAKYKLKVSQLKAYNKLSSNMIKPNQKLIVSKYAKKSAPKSVARAPKKSTGTKSNGVYTVRPGDSLYAIALRHKVKVAQIQGWNGLQSNTIKPGQKLKILKGVKPGQKVIYHRIKTGETLWSVSRQYQVKISDIMEWNELDNDRVKPNQKLKIIALNKKRSTQATM